MKSATGWATAAGLCVLAFPGAWAETASRSDPGEEVAGVEAPTQGGGRLAPQELAWSRQDIELAEARCSALLRGLDVIAVPEVPIREGPACGSPAPRKLISIGKRPEIAFSPPPTLTCDMIAALHKWLLHDVEPLARTHLGAPVIRIEAMSAYSCRNAYGRANGRLSEHGRANALDIGAFTTALGHSIVVVADWGPTGREIAAAAAAARSERGVEEKGSPSSQPEGVQIKALAAAGPRLEPAEPQAWQQSGFAFGMPGITVWPGASPTIGLAVAPPNRLGGPKGSEASAHADLAGEKEDFLRAAHRAACKIFGTVLGPEANSAHKNHFHLDMAERKVAVICE